MTIGLKTEILRQSEASEKDTTVTFGCRVYRKSRWRPCAVFAILSIAIHTHAAPFDEKSSAAAVQRAAGGGEPAAPASSALTPDPKADEVVNAMVATLTQAKNLSYKTTTTWKSKNWRSSVEETVSHQVTLARPDRLSIASQSTSPMTVVCDGKDLYTCSVSKKKYSQEPAPRDVSDAVREARVSPMDQFALAFALPELRTIMLEGASEAKYAGLESIDGVQAHRLHFVQKGMKWDLWVKRAAPTIPLQMRLIPDPGSGGGCASALGAVQDILVKFSGWTVNVALPKNTFVFTPPVGAEKVASLLEEESELLGKPAPPLALDLLGGAKLDFANHRGKDIVILDFWAAWCEPCREALPIVGKIAQEYRDKHVVLYAVNQGEDQNTIKQFLRAQNLNVPVALDPTESARAPYGLSSIPVSVVIAKDGTIRAVHNGLSPNLGARLKRELDTLIRDASEAPPTGAGK